MTYLSSRKPSISTFFRAGCTLLGASLFAAGVAACGGSSDKGQTLDAGVDAHTADASQDGGPPDSGEVHLEGGVIDSSTDTGITDTGMNDSAIVVPQLAKLRILHLLHGAGMSISANIAGTNPTAFQGIGPQKISDYAVVNAGDHNLNVTNASGALGSTSLQIDANTENTLVVYGDINSILQPNGIAFQYVTEEWNDRTSADASLRAIYAAPGLGNWTGGQNGALGLWYTNGMGTLGDLLGSSRTTMRGDEVPTVGTPDDIAPPGSRWGFILDHNHDGVLDATDHTCLLNFSAGQVYDLYPYRDPAGTHFVLAVTQRDLTAYQCM